MDVKFTDLRQRHLVAWERDIKDNTDAESVTVSEWAGAIVAAAIRAGWLSAPDWTLETIGDALPRDVRAVAEAVMQKHTELTSVLPS